MRRKSAGSCTPVRRMLSSAAIFQRAVIFSGERSDTAHRRGVSCGFWRQAKRCRAPPRRKLWLLAASEATLCTAQTVKSEDRTIPNPSLPSQRDGPLRKQGSAASSTRAAAQQAANAAKQLSISNHSLPSHWDAPLRKQGSAASSTHAAIEPAPTGQPTQIAAKELAADLAETPPQATAHKTHSKECWPALTGREGRFWTSQFLPHFAQ